MDRNSITMDFQKMIRKKIELDENFAFFILIDGLLTFNLNATLGEIYDKHQKKDGFLYFVYAYMEDKG